MVDSNGENGGGDDGASNEEDEDGPTRLDRNSGLAVYYTGVYGWGYVISCNDMYGVRVLHQIAGDSALALTDPARLVGIGSGVRTGPGQAAPDSGVVEFGVVTGREA
ncbi:hypothetical protein Sjap_007096 [Stephania japonica]|uniref:Uncharacterized protein n=1 Tax=Stephania japonica TaxID=461633 RepID=A0AAP0JPB1_9MAGN